MSKHRQAPKPPQPGEKTQVLGQDALRAALEPSPEPTAGQPTVVIPAGLPMLEDLPPASEESTQPIPKFQVAPATDRDAEALAIVNGPDATWAMKAGAPATPEDWGATQALPAGEPPLPVPASTQILPTGLPELPRSLETQVMATEEPGKTQVLHTAPPAPAKNWQTQVMPPEVRTIELPPDQLPSAPRKGMPLWGWAGLAALVLGLTAGALYFLRPDLLGLGTPDSSAKEATANEPSSSQAQPQASEEAAPEVPPALRPYLEKAEKGDAAAMRMLGVMYYNGLNVAKNEKEGLKWYRKAANAGSKAAQKELKQMGVER